MTDVSRILSQIERGDPAAAEQLLPLVYQELRRLAAANLASEKPGQTLQPTALVHEAYLRLIGEGDPQEWDSRGHFFAAAAEAMRRILIETARRKATLKHGGGQRRVTLLDADAVAQAPDGQMLALDEAITELDRVDRRKAELVKLRYFAGLEETEAAAALGISRATASRWWAFAKAWLFDWMKRQL